MLLLSTLAIVSTAVIVEGFGVNLVQQRRGGQPRIVVASTTRISAVEGGPEESSKDIFSLDGWPAIQDDLDRVPMFTVATEEGNPLAYQVELDSKTFTVPFFYCDVADALAELEGARNNTEMAGLDVLPFPLGKAFQMWCEDDAVIVPSKQAILQAGAPPGTNPVGQQVPMFACLEIMEEDEEDGSARLPLFMALDDANAAVKAAVDEDGGTDEKLKVVTLSLSGAIEQLATIPDTPGFHFIPPSSSMRYIQEYLS